MKLKDYSAAIVALAEKYPDALVVYSADDEGNAFGPVHFPPAVGLYDDCGEFSQELEGQEPNSVCIN